MTFRWTTAQSTTDQGKTMPKNKTETHVVEFWPKPFKEVQDHEIPQTTECESPESAIALEARFHGIGWPARALTLNRRTDRLNLTSKSF
jgi:hypothetical protein